MSARLICLMAAAMLVVAVAPAALAAPRGNGERVRAIVVLNDRGNPHADARDFERRHNGRVERVYGHAVKGFAGEFPRGSLARMQRDRRVESVELDQLAHTFSHTGQNVPTGVRRVFADDNPNLGLDAVDDERIDVDVAIIDTGIDDTHPDLNDVGGVNCTAGSLFGVYCQVGRFNDDQGHGTHVAGTVGALDNGVGVVGVAPGARLWDVKVLGSGGSGYLSWIIAGIDWVTANASTIEVANMSLGCECSSWALNRAISRSVAAGVTYVVAAGNSGRDAATFSPANHPDVITVSALADFDGEPGGRGTPICRWDRDDTLANFSNFGSHVDVTAPGVCILSTWKDGRYGRLSGTSMASPHVAGAAAVLAATSGIDTPAQIRDTLVATGNLDWTDDSGDGITEPLLDVHDPSIFAPAVIAGLG